MGMSRRKTVEVIDTVPGLDGEELVDLAADVAEKAVDVAEKATEAVEKGGSFIKKLLVLTILGLIAYVIYKMVSSDNSPPQIDLAASYPSEADTESVDEPVG
jgi:hypothetical protein